MPRIDPDLLRELWERSGAARWDVTPARFADVLERSMAKAFPAGAPDDGTAARYLRALHLQDLALACACEDGHEGAWDHFVREFRPALYRAAGAMAPGGGARDLADALYADLFGLTGKGGARQSLLRYFHGRSALGTWLRSVLAQRHVDRVRSERRLQPLPETMEVTLAGPAARDTPDLPRQMTIFTAALAAVMAALASRDRLRLACYYAQQLTLAQIGRLTGEHEATVSRHLARTRRDVRRAVEARLRDQHGMGQAEIDECFAAAASHAGELDLDAVLEAAEGRKIPGRERSKTV